MLFAAREHFGREMKAVMNEQSGTTTKFSVGFCEQKSGQNKMRKCHQWNAANMACSPDLMNVSSILLCLLFGALDGLRRAVLAPPSAALNY